MGSVEDSIGIFLSIIGKLGSRRSAVAYLDLQVQPKLHYKPIQYNTIQLIVRHTLVYQAYVQSALARCTHTMSSPNSGIVATVSTAELSCKRPRSLAIFPETKKSVGIRREKFLQE